VADKAITVSNLQQNEWINPFGATPEELLASALEDSGLMGKKTLINGETGSSVYQEYCKKRNLFQEATRLGNILVKQDIISNEQLAEALAEQVTTARPLGEILTQLNFCTERDLEDALERQKAIREEFLKLEETRTRRSTIWKRIAEFFFDIRD
jgi:hypothetical protein